MKIYNLKQEDFFDYNAQMLTVVSNSFQFLNQAILSEDLDRAKRMSEKYESYLCKLVAFHQNYRSGMALRLYDNPEKLRELYLKIVDG